MNPSNLKSSALPRPAFVSSREVRVSRGQFEAATSILERLADLVAVVAGVLLAYVSYSLLHIGRHLNYSMPTVFVAALVFGLIFVLMLENDGAYYRANSLLRIRETERILRVSTQAFAIMLSITFLSSHLFSRWVLVLAFVLVPLLLVAEKQCLILLVRHLHSRGYGLQNVLVYGAGYTGRMVFSALVRSPMLGLKPVAIVDDDSSLAGQQVYEYGYNRGRSVPVIAGPVTRDLIRELHGGLVLIGIPSLPRRKLQEIAAEAAEAKADVAFVPQLSFSSETSASYVDIDGVLIASLGQANRKRLYATTKRMFDFIAALGLLAVSSPLWALFAVLIRSDSKGPVFFSQTRVGLNGKLFELYKFRSMFVEAPQYSLHPNRANDPRVTRVGRWLRKSSLDELPQLLNVLRGDMSLVGPRPEMPFIVASYNAHHRQRLQVTPGLTGLWQLSAERSFLIHENIQYDLYYIRDRNFFMDLAILLHTAAFAVKGV